MQVTSRGTAIATFSAPSFPPATLSGVFVSDGNELLLIETDTGAVVTAYQNVARGQFWAKSHIPIRRLFGTWPTRDAVGKFPANFQLVGKKFPFEGNFQEGDDPPRIWQVSTIGASTCCILLRDNTDQLETITLICAKRMNPNVTPISLRQAFSDGKVMSGGFPVALHATRQPNLRQDSYMVSHCRGTVAR